MDIALDVKQKRQQGKDSQQLASYDHLTWALEAAHGAAWDWDLKNGETWWPPEMYKLWGLKHGTRMTGANTLAMVDERDRQRIRDAIAKNIADHTDIHHEFRINHPKLGLRWMEARGQVIYDKTDTPVRIVGVMLDITERKRADEAMRESEAHFRFMAESLPQKFFTADPVGKVTYFNSQWTEYTGVPMDKIHRDGVRHFVHPDDLSENMRSWRQAIKDGKPLQNEQRLRRADGQYRLHISYVNAMRDESGKIVRWFGSMTDIEDLTQASMRKEELEQKTATLKEQRAQLIAISNAKDEFISLASHQLRTPATAVKQYIGMLLEGFAGEVDEGHLDFLQRAYDSNERQLKIVNDLLKVARVNSGKVKLKAEKVDLEPMLREVIEAQAGKFAEKNQKVSLQATKTPCYVLADKELLRMSLENLIDNAGKYTYEGKAINVKLEKSKGNMEVIVKDEGVGIPKDQMSKLFQKFSRLDNPLSVTAAGTGLGLYWVKKIVELHKGKITVTSQENKGTTFTLSLAAYHK